MRRGRASSLHNNGLRVYVIPYPLSVIASPQQVKTWTVHGLWPKLRNDCNNSWHFSWEKIKSLEKQLETSWPNLNCKTKKRSLWEHEWQKHGTCATTFKATNNEFHYFQKTLSLNSVAAFNPQKALEKAGITPSCKKAYPIQAIKNAVIKYFRIKDYLRMDCAMQRYPETNTSRTLLMSIYIPLSKTFNVTTLPYQYTQSCQPGDKVYIFPVHDVYCSK
ncbi:ribonuclease Oy-like [Haliotis rubra]|uniref:ribonuclease Oy-like n=1 Tax=Haliotis rubra TaxID=36100 RepID=UPI001EE563F6|nr:ribonuclease Oy-like [Haliotis rubra]